MSATHDIERCLTYEQVKEIVHYSRMHLSRLERESAFPRRIRLGAGRVVWKMSEVMSWLEAKRAEPTAPRGKGK